MKICFLSNYISGLGGVQRVLSVISSEVAKKHAVDIVCIFNNEDISKLDRSIYNLSEKVNVIDKRELMNRKPLTKAISRFGKEINNKTGILNKKNTIETLTKVYYPKEVQDNFVNYFNSKDYDVIIAVEGYFSLLLGIIAKRLTAKTVGWQHSVYEAYLKRRGEYYWNQDLLFKDHLANLDNYIVLTESDKRNLKEKMDINSIVIGNPKSFKSTEKSSLENRTFLAAGRFTVQKGFDLLIKSFNEFCTKNSVWNLVIVGDGDDKEKIMKLIDKYNLSGRVTLQGVTNDIKGYFLKSSALLLPSRVEGMPMIVLESLEMGVPVVAYDITAVENLIKDNIHGKVVEKYNIKKFADAMVEISNSYELRMKMSQNAIHKAKEFEVDNIIKKWDKLLKSI